VLAPPFIRATPSATTLRSTQCSSAPLPSSLSSNGPTDSTRGSLKAVLPRALAEWASAHCEYSRHAAAGAFQSLLDRFCADGAAGLKSKARQLCSCASRSASTFLDTLPMADPLTISDAAFTSGMRHRLGLSQMPPGALVVACDCLAGRPPPSLQTMPWSATLA
jgi:hypothetical protein